MIRIEGKRGIQFRDKDQGKVMEMEIYYSLGGINYFTGGTNRRGIYAMITPVELNGTMKSFTLMGSKSGMKMLLEELPRKSQKKVDSWAKRIEPIAEKILNRAKEQDVRAGLGLLKEEMVV